jgi:hypothetical protein
LRLGFATQPQLALNLWSFCLSPQSAGTVDMHHHTWLPLSSLSNSWNILESLWVT